MSWWGQRGLLVLGCPRGCGLVTVCGHCSMRLLLSPFSHQTLWPRVVTTRSVNSLWCFKLCQEAGYVTSFKDCKMATTASWSIKMFQIRKRNKKDERQYQREKTTSLPCYPIPTDATLSNNSFKTWGKHWLSGWYRVQTYITLLYTTCSIPDRWAWATLTYSLPFCTGTVLPLIHLGFAC